MKATNKKLKAKKEKRKLSRRRIFRKKNKPQDMVFGYQSNRDSKMNLDRRKIKIQRAGTLPKIGSNKKEENSQKPTKKAPVHTIKGKIVKLNPLLFPENLDHKPFLFAIKHTQEELFFALACRDAIKIYKLDPTSSYKDPPELVLSKYNERFINTPKIGPPKNQKRRTMKKFHASTSYLLTILEILRKENLIPMKI